MDGVEVETTKALGALIAFAIDGEAGQTHRVEMVYRPHTYTVGLSVTLLSGVLLLLLIILEKRLAKIPVLRTVVTVVPYEKKAKKTKNAEESNEQSDEQSTNGE